MMNVVPTMVVVLGVLALGMWLFNDDDHDEWRGY